MSRKQSPQQNYASYRSIQFDLGHAVVNTNLFARPETVLRDYSVLSWVFSEAPQLSVNPGSDDALQFLTQLYIGWYPTNSFTDTSLSTQTKTLCDRINTDPLSTTQEVLEEFFARYMGHYDDWARNTSERDREAFKAAAILKDVMYQHAFVHRPEEFGIHDAYTNLYNTEFSVRELDTSVDWRTSLLTESEYTMATQYLSDTDITTVEDYVGAIIQLLERHSKRTD